MPGVKGAMPPLDFYPRPPRGGRLVHDRIDRSAHAFLSTPSARRATSADCLRPVLLQISIHALREEGDVLRRPSRRFPCYFYPRPPRGGRPENNTFGQRTRKISIHALREEGDRYLSGHMSKSGTFLSTPSARRATNGKRAAIPRYFISIHALREEGDMQDRTGSYGQQNFYPRPPRGGRPST